MIFSLEHVQHQMEQFNLHEKPIFYAYGALILFQEYHNLTYFCFILRTDVKYLFTTQKTTSVENAHIYKGKKHWYTLTVTGSFFFERFVSMQTSACTCIQNDQIYSADFFTDSSICDHS